MRYGLTLLGALAIGTFVVVSVLFIAQSSTDKLIEINLRSRAANFAAFLVSPQGSLDAFKTGIARNADAETRVRRVASLSDIRSFKIFDQSGREVFQSRSDRYEWLLRDRPGGSRSGDRLSDAILAKTGNWQIVEARGDDEGMSVLSSLTRGGQTVGYLSITSENSALYRSGFRATLMESSGHLLMTLATALGLPLLLYLRRKRKIAEADEHIRFLATHDSLTKLLNRRAMQDECDKLLSTVRATREKMAYLFVDIDDIAEINDRLGQTAGDELLAVIAARLSNIVSASGDKVARIGPDDFGILHRRMDSYEEAEHLARQLASAVAEPVELNGCLVTPTVSIGCAVVPRDGQSHSELVKHAEIAHQHHKGEKNRNLVFFEPSMDEAVQRRRELEAMIRTALANGQFEVFYQPIVSGLDGSLLGFEALLRMRDGNGDYVSPAEFIPVAETRGYVKELGSFVIREASRQIAQWPEHLFVSINISTIQFADDDLVPMIEAALRAAGIDGARLEIEVVESLLLDRSDMVLDQLRRLKALGVMIDMDDFGTGYSSLSYLWRFPFDKVKIDQSFMVAYENGEKKVERIVEAIVSMAHHMAMKVTVEGVETARQMEFVKSLKCDQIQGYFFAKPMPADKVAAELLGRFSAERIGDAKPDPQSHPRKRLARS